MLCSAPEIRNPTHPVARKRPAVHDAAQSPSHPATKSLSPPSHPVSVVTSSPSQCRSQCRHQFTQSSGQDAARHRVSVRVTVPINPHRPSCPTDTAPGDRKNPHGQHAEARHTPIYSRRESSRSAYSPVTHARLASVTNLRRALKTRKYRCWLK
jgi:hypothetical protein